MVYTVARALDVVRHAGYSTTGLPARDYVNEAGWRLLSMRLWAWAQVPPTQLSVRVSQGFTGATWTAATRLLTGTGIGTGYTHWPGDNLTITAAGTGADLRDVEIEERVDANTLRLKDSISSSDQTGIGLTINANRAVILPSDYGGRLRAVETTSGRTISFEVISQSALMYLRSIDTVPVTGMYSGAIYYAEDLTAGGGPQQARLELYPYPTDGAPNFLTVVYSRAWRAREKDSDILSIPPWIEPLYTEVLRAVTAGYEDEERATVVERIAQVRGGPTFADAATHDSLSQASYGYVGGGAEMAEAWPDFGWWSGQGTVPDLP